MADMAKSTSTLKEAREFYELKEKAAKFYVENGVPQKMEEILNDMFYDNPTDVYGHLAEYFQAFAKTPMITKLRARQALDSKAQPTIQTEVFCTVNNKEKLVSTNLSSSTTPVVSELAKPEERDEEDKERDENVTAAIKFLNTDISNRLQGLDPSNQEEVDSLVSTFISDLFSEEGARLAREAEERAASGDQTEEANKKSGSATSKDKAKSPKGKGGKGAPAVVVIPDEPRERLLCGSGCVSATSQAVCAAAAATRHKQLYEHVADLRFGNEPGARDSPEYCLPLPMVTILQSGRAAPGKCACIKEFMVVPKPGKPLKETVPQIMAIYNDVVKSVLNKSGVAAKNVSDTGAIMMPFDRPEQGLDMLQEAMTHCDLVPGEDFFIALNLAGHEIFDYVVVDNREKGKYEVVTGQQKVADDMVEFWAELLGKYPSIIAIIDPLRKQESMQWMNLCERVSERCYVVGEHVYHRPGLLKNEVLDESFQTSGVVFKLEQMNTVSDLLKCAKKMEDEKNVTVISASIGETTDTFTADMAVGLKARFLKIGAPCRGERVAKLNRLLAIEEQLQEAGQLGYHTDFQFPLVAPPPPAPEGEDGEQEDEGKKETPRKK